MRGYERKGRGGGRTKAGRNHIRLLGRLAYGQVIVDAELAIAVVAVARRGQRDDGAVGEARAFAEQQGARGG